MYPNFEEPFELINGYPWHMLYILAVHDDYRINIWYLFNDRVRKGKPLFKNNTDEIIWQENLHKLLDLLDIGDRNKMIMVAEIHRNLGDFDECLSIIEGLASPKMDWLTEKFKVECKNQNTLVFQLV